MWEGKLAMRTLLKSAEAQPPKLMEDRTMIWIVSQLAIDLPVALTDARNFAKSYKAARAAMDATLARIPHVRRMQWGTREGIVFIPTAALSAMHAAVTVRTAVVEDKVIRGLLIGKHQFERFA